MVVSIFSLGTPAEKTEKLSELLVDEQGKQGLNEIKELLEMTEAEFDCSLARGLSYYTGTVIEIFLKKGNIKSAVAAGGRYDKLISSFLSSKQEYPAVGISFGLDVLNDAIKKKSKQTVTQLFIIPINTQKESMKICQKFRDAGIKTEIDIMDRGPSKNLKYANSKSIPFIAFIGEDELKKGKVKLKDMNSGKEKFLSVDDAIAEIK
jgi:histidyl-tRNA synthetase